MGWGTQALEARVERTPGLGMLCGDSSAVTHCEHTATTDAVGQTCFKPCREGLLLGKAADDSPGSVPSTTI